MRDGIGLIASLALVVCALQTAPVIAQTPAPGGSENQPYRTFTPSAPGPHPAIMFVAGCSGYAPKGVPVHYTDRAEELRGQGYLVIFVDPLGRRGLETCAGRLTADQAAPDVLEATQYLKTNPRADQNRITAMGWSFGASTIIQALARAGASPPFSKAVLLYPPCGGLSAWQAPIPVLMLLGASDDVAPAKVCDAFVTKLGGTARLTKKTYPGAHHGFDNAALTERIRYPFGTLEYNEKAATEARSEIEQFLRQ